MSNEEIIIWFRENYAQLPLTLLSRSGYYHDLKKTVTIYLSDGKRYAHLLRQIHEALRIQSNHNAPKPEWNKFHNRIGSIEVVYREPVHPECSILIEEGLYVDHKNKSIAIPDGYRASKEAYKVLEKLHKAGYLSQKSTIA